MAPAPGQAAPAGGGGGALMGVAAGVWAAVLATFRMRTSSIMPLKGVPPLPRSPIFRGELPSFGLRVAASEPSATPLTNTRRVAPSHDPATCTHWPAGM